MIRAENIVKIYDPSRPEVQALAGGKGRGAAENNKKRSAVRSVFVLICDHSSSSPGSSASSRFPPRSAPNFMSASS